MDYVRSAKRILCAVIILACLIMGSCTDEAPGETILASTAPELQASDTYTVRFFAEDAEIDSFSVNMGEFPTVPEVDDLRGARFAGWVDENGRRAEPAATPVAGDAEYHAVFLPVLGGHAPYLFTDGDGLLRPDAVLDSTELVTALNALASEEAKARFPESFPADDAITANELRDVLASFFTYEEMDRVILGFSDVDKLSRAQFAVIMNGLLGRSTDEKVAVSEDDYRIPDISLQRSDYTQLMEAAVEHIHSESGEVWRNITLPALYEEGYVLVDGALYMVDGEGFFLSDTVLGSLTFGYDGRYTCGDTNLDSYVRAVIADITEGSPNVDRAEILESAYNYCCDTFEFSRRNIYDVGARGWELSEAVIMFETKNGNSCSYAAAFWAIARGLGYEANAVSGAVGKDMQHHAWVEIVIDGTNYIFDPAMADGAVEGVEAGRDCFMFPEGWSAMYQYYKGE